MAMKHDLENLDAGQLDFMWSMMRLRKGGATKNDVQAFKGHLDAIRQALQKQYDDFSRECDLTDTLRRNSPKATNFDTAIVRAVQSLRSYGIDYHDILPDTAHIMISDSKGNSRDVDDFIAEMERKR